ncbi:unnamed protein product [marine sediment metagenome]|uniref:MIT domain-containing protein n=1 Tax=marine sediment metagenome TaxID=412755 RepID=X1IXD9_9ZZZZ
MSKGWAEQALIYTNQIKIYQEKLESDKKLREIEKQKITEEELLKLKTQALTVKKRSAMEYESKKNLAFDFMELAKNELKQNNFEYAVSYYQEAEKIFAEIKWPEGIRMIKESINVIKIKKKRIEREAILAEVSV